MAIKKLNDAGKEHEEFRLTLQKDKEIALAEIHIQKDIAEAQASVLGEAFRNAKIDIVGGDNTFFDNVVRQVSNGKGLDKLIDNSYHLSQLSDNLLGQGDGEENIIGKIRNLADKYDVSSEDIKNLSIAALVARIQTSATGSDKGFLNNLLSFAKGLGIENKKIQQLMG